MDDDDAELTRQAVEEILRDMKTKQQVPATQEERKINPLGRANKQFLGRTINAVLCHNKRTDEQTRKKCRKKLRELDKSIGKEVKSSKQIHNKKYKIKKKRGSKEKVYETDSETDSDVSRHKSTKRRNKRKKSKTKHKKSKRRKKRQESHGSRSSFSPESVQKSDHENFEYVQNEFNTEAQAYAAALALQPMMWNMQMLQYKAFMALSASSPSTTNPTVQIEELNSNSPSLSDITLGDPTISDEEILTINLTNEDDDRKEYKADTVQSTQTEIISSSSSSSVELLDSDVESEQNIINLASAENTIDLTEE